MRYFLIILILISSSAAYAQIRPFDNSKAILPWIYNPAADLSEDIQAYVGYDGRGNSSFTPQSVIAGVRMALPGNKTPRSRGKSAMAGLQVLNTSQTLLNALTINLNFAQQISINSSTRFAFGIGGGIYTLRYDHDALVYMDVQDPLLNNGENLFNLHLNAGVSLVVSDQFFVNVAAPNLLQNESANIDEIIVRAGYSIPVTAELKLIPAANLDTYNGNLIYGGDLRMEWRKILSVMAGGDRYKYHAGLLLDFEAFAFGYTFGQNFNNALNNVQSHQISILAAFSGFK